MNEPLILAALAGTFFLAGSVKGVIGLGLPTVTLAILSVLLDLPQAMALLLVPSFLTNIWQAFYGGNVLALLKRIYPFILMAISTVWIGAMALTRVDLHLLSASLGFLLAVYAAISLANFRLHIAAHHQAWSGIVFGAINGVLTGMTGSFVVPGVMYLQALGLPRDALIQAMGLLFAASTLALAVALGGNNLLSFELGLLSTLGVVPAIAGMIAGRHIRKQLSEAIFRKIFFVSLFILGCYISLTALK